MSITARTRTQLRLALMNYKTFKSNLLIALVDMDEHDLKVIRLELVKKANELRTSLEELQSKINE